ncbi:MAG TPA: polyprenol monophosphomannose synthase [Candidatus Thermoplasmatota archaeon]|nr:polyprenol monophosphomannose synthase [Candidatus Thermoplasmatota archaeon]
MSKAPSLVLFTLTYNERENLPLLVERLRALGLPNARFVVVDDNSPDGTGKVADELSRRHPDFVTVHHRAAKEGYGAAYKDAVETIRRRFDPDRYLSMDADLSHDPADLPRLLDRLDAGADLAIGSRLARGSVVVGRPWMRRLTTRVANLLVARLIAGNYPVRDNTNGYRAFTREVVEAIPWDHLQANKGYSFLTSFLAIVYRKGFRIEEVPITFREREHGASKLGFRQLFGFVGNALHLRWRISVLRLYRAERAQARPPR